MLSRRKRLTTKENIEDDKARRGKGTSSTTFISSSSSKTILLLLCFPRFCHRHHRVFFRVRRKEEEEEVRESHVMSVGLLLRERTTRSVKFSLSLVCATNERCAHLYQYLLLLRRRRRFRRRWSKSKEKASGRSWETRESRESVLGTRGRLGNPQEKPRGDSVGERYITTTLLLSPRIF